MEANETTEQQSNNELQSEILNSELIEIAEEPLTGAEIIERLEKTIEYNRQFENDNVIKSRHDVLFENLFNSYKKTVIQYCNEKLAKARDVFYVQKSLVEKFVNALAKPDDIPEKVLSGIDYFVDRYMRNDDFEISLNYLRIIYPEVFQQTIPDTSHDYIKPLAFSEQDEQILNQFPIETHAFVKYICMLLVYDKVVLSLLSNKNQPKKPSLQTAPFKWTSVKDNKTEFVQIIYALHEAGYIDNGKGEITKIVEASAEFFNVGLSKHWQSNHSSSIHSSKRNHPPVFDKLKESYKAYSDKQQQVEHTTQKLKVA